MNFMYILLTVNIKENNIILLKGFLLQNCIHKKNIYNTKDKLLNVLILFFNFIKRAFLCVFIDKKNLCSRVS